MHSELMWEYFQVEGEHLTVSGSHWQNLNRQDQVWMVDAEKVEVFLVKLNNNQPIGARTHFATVNRGMVIWGVDHERLGLDTGLIAVGLPGARLLQLPRSRLIEHAMTEECSEYVGLLFAEWADKWAAKLGEHFHPRNSRIIRGNERSTFAAGESARTQKEFLWIQHASGVSRYLGRKKCVLSSSKLFFPLSGEGWLEVDDDTEFTTIGTRTYTEQDPQWLGIDFFHEIALREIVSDIAKNRFVEHRQMEFKAENDQLRLEAALQQFVEVLNPGMQSRGAEGCESDALVSVCKLVGEAAEISVVAPRQDLQKGRDPLEAIARINRFRYRKVILKGQWWRQDSGPLLAYLAKDKQPVGLLPVSPGRYVLFDPITGKRSAISSQQAEGLEPAAFQFYRPFPEKILKGFEIFKQGLQYCKGDLIIIVTMGILGAMLGLLTPITIGIVFDSIIPGANRNQLVQISIILVTCAIATAMFEITKGVALMRLEGKMDASVQAGVMDRLLGLPVPFFRRYTSGDLANRTMGISTIRQILSGITLQTILSAVFSTVYLVLLFWYDWQLALLAMGLSAFGVIFTLVASYFQIGYQKKIAAQQGTISGIVFQFINGISKLRGSSAENRAFSIWADEFSKMKKMAYKAGTVGNILATFNGTFPILTSMAIFGWIVWSEMEGFSTGSFLAFNSAFGNFQGALLQMSTALMGILNIIPLYERAKPIFETLPEVDEAKAMPAELAGGIEVNHVHFRYDSEGSLIINDVSLTVRPGQFVALVGSSGSGKSTMLRLLLGFEKPDSGSLYYDGQDLAVLDIREVRRQMGVVLQNGVLMSGDIFKNIIGSSSLTIEDAWEAARMAGLEKDIKDMPMGMHTVLPPGGGTLSGGQRQRLLIARAIVNKPRILFFDEATSALDNKSQAVVSRSLENLQATRIVIAHRLSTIINADKIIVLDKGRIVQSGTYDELIVQKGMFSEMAQRQLV